MWPGQCRRKWNHQLYCSQPASSTQSTRGAGHPAPRVQPGGGHMGRKGTPGLRSTRLGQLAAPVLSLVSQAISPQQLPMKDVTQGWILLKFREMTSGFYSFKHLPLVNVLHQYSLGASSMPGGVRDDGEATMNKTKGPLPANTRPSSSVNWAPLRVHFPEATPEASFSCLTS